MLLTFFGCIGIFFAVNAGGNYLIENIYLSDSAVKDRTNNYYISFKKYVDDNDIKSDNIHGIYKWLNNNPEVYIMIYKDKKIVFESGYDESYYNDQSTDDEEYDSADDILLDDTSFSMKMADGDAVVSFIDFSEENLYTILNYIAIGCSFIIYFIIIMSYNKKVINRVTTLSKKVERVANGNINMKIPHKGNDEIAQLATSTDIMRQSIVERLENEQQALKSNYELVTAMSHDLRTPLTALLGYLDIIESKKYTSQEQLDKFVKAGREKGYQLKELSDKLFNYFYVFSNKEQERTVDKLDAEIFLEQIIGEHMIYFKEKGYIFEIKKISVPCNIYIDINDIRRMFDNIFFNIEKYADKASVIKIISKVKDENIYIDISNKISSNRNVEASTKVGLKTCKKILETNNGTFESFDNGKIFTVKISLPVEVK